MRRISAIALALVAVAVGLQGGAAGRADVPVAEVSFATSIDGWNVTFHLVCDPSLELPETIRVVPVPLPFEEGDGTGCWETGWLAARLVTNGETGVGILIPALERLTAEATDLRVQGPMVFEVDVVTPGTAVLGPVALVLDDAGAMPSGDGGQIIHIRPDIEDDAY